MYFRKQTEGRPFGGAAPVNWQPPLSCAVRSPGSHHPVVLSGHPAVAILLCCSVTRQSPSSLAVRPLGSHHRLRCPSSRQPPSLTVRPLGSHHSLRGPSSRQPSSLAVRTFRQLSISFAVCTFRQLSIFFAVRTFRQPSLLLAVCYPAVSPFITREPLPYRSRFMLNEI